MNIKSIGTYVKNSAKVVTEFASKNSPAILTGVAVAGVISTVIFTTTATVKAVRKVDEEIKKREEEAEELTKKQHYPCPPVEITKMDVVKMCWKDYIPALSTAILTGTCVICANTISTRRTAALATAYSVSEKALKEFEERTKEEIGEKKVQKIKDKIAEEEVKNNPPVKSNVILTGNGEVLCYDSFSGRYFKSNVERLRRIENDLNYRLLSEMFISLNDLYYEIGLPPLPQGGEFGWDVNNDGFIKFEFSSCLAEEKDLGVSENTPCMVVGYRVGPRYDCRNLM